MIDVERDRIRAEISGLKAVLYALCAVLPPEQSRNFHSLLQHQLDRIQTELNPSAEASEFMQKMIDTIKDFMLLSKSE